MLARMLAGVTVAVGIVCGAASLAQQPSEPTPSPVELPPDTKDGPPAPTPSESPQDLPTPAPLEQVSAPEPTSPPSPAPETDPEKAVETFMERNRKEASEAIKNLTRERDELHVRLKKVESALARWQAVADALDGNGKRDQPRRERVSNRPTIIESVPADAQDLVPAGSTTSPR